MGPLIVKALPPETTEDHPARWISVPKELVGEVVELVAEYRVNNRKSVTNLGRKLRAYRVTNDMILYDMAKEIGVSSASLSSFERGAELLAEIFVKINERIKVLYLID